MNWITNSVLPKIKAWVQADEVPDNLWIKCSACSQMIFHREYEQAFNCCATCGHHAPLSPENRFALLFDDSNFEVITLPLPEDQGTGLGKPLKIITHPLRPNIPIHIASLGPKNVALTAELAEGWLPTLFMPEKADLAFGDALKVGLEKRSHDLPPLDVVAGGMVAIGDDVKQYLDFGRPNTALYVGGMGARGKNFYNSLVQRYGFEREALEIQDLYLSGKKKEAEAAVPQELLEGMNLVGPEGYIKEKVAQFAEAGVTYLNIGPIGSPDEQMRIVEKLKEIVS